MEPQILNLSELLTVPGVVTEYVATLYYPRYFIFLFTGLVL